MHLVLAVSDVDRAYAFYREVFGWESHIEWPGEYTELVVTDEDRLGLYRRDGWAQSAGAEPAELNGKVSPAYLYVRVDDLDETLGRLEQAGARPLSARSRRGWGEEAAYFADPDGNVVAVARRLTQ
jgi:catechol 2,3-dioxygenase-like lactoylglutathione lyase family enzyme